MARTLLGGLAVLVALRAQGAPIAPQGVPPEQALKFMKRFGYLDPGLPDSEALYSEQGITDAIKAVQRFGAIPETGNLDNETLKLMQSKRCGVPDIMREKSKRTKRYIVGSEGWKKREITYFVANWSPKVGEEAVVDEMQRAFDAWSGYARLRFRHVQDPNADIVVAFGRGPHGDWYPFDGPGNILAHAYYPYEMASFGGDIHFDDDEDWKIRPGEFDDGVDFFTVAVHELGHSLGLAHSPVSGSIMFPYYKGYQSNFQLDYDDILAMYELYISRNLEGDNATTSVQNGPDTRSDEAVDEDGDDDNSNNDDSTRDSDADNGGHNTPKPDFPSSTPDYDNSEEIDVTFVGDDETVDDHIGHDPTRSLPSEPTVSTIPNICEGKFDSIASLRGELFVFKGEYAWRLSELNDIQPGYPVPFRQLFWKLPQSVKQLDAVYQRDTDGSIILFAGNKYWVYNGEDFIENSPRPITDYGFAKDVNEVNAALVWNKSGKTFLFSGDRYWRFNETTRQLDQGYPHNIARWRGVPSNMDAALTWTDGITYFFKGNLFWRFNNQLIKTDDSYPLPAAENWLGCLGSPANRTI